MALAQRKTVKFIAPFFLFLVLFLGLFFFSSAQAQYNYEPMEKVPGFEEATGFLGYVLAIYKFGIWTVGLVAMFMIIFGGFTYMTAAGNTARMDKAKGMIFDAFYGLIIALAAWLILFVINPDLVKINLSLKSVPLYSAPSAYLPPPSSSGMVSWPPEGLTPTDAALRTQLANAGISVNKANCTYVGQTNCTSLDGLPQSTVDKLIAAKAVVGDFTITGGTEYWLHRSHGPGKPVVDIWPTAPKSQWNSIIQTLQNQFGATVAFCDVNGIAVSCTNPAAHIHVKF